MGLKRFVQKTGVSTLTVSLPKNWAEKNGVGKGTEVFLVEQPDGTLVITTKMAEEKRENFDLSVSDVSSKEDLKRLFYSAYLAGFDSVRLHSASKISPEWRKTILAETKRLIGMEIIEETPNVIIVKDFFSREGLSVEKTLKRMHLIACSLFEDLLEGKELDAVAERDDEVDRLRFLVLRQLNLALKNPPVLRSLGLSANRCIDYATVTLYVERVADKITAIAKIMSKDQAKGVRPHLEKAYALYQDSVKAFLEKDFTLAMKVINARTPFFNEMDDLNKKLGQKGVTYAPVLEHTNSIVEHAFGIAEQAINQS